MRGQVQERSDGREGGSARSQETQLERIDETAAANAHPLSGAEWIWLPEDQASVNEYADFSHSFELPTADPAATLYVSADTEYAVYLNGRFVDAGQYDDFPERKAYDSLPVGQWLVDGANVLTITVHYQGVDSFQYVKGRAGVIYALRTSDGDIASGAGTQCRSSPVYRSGAMPLATMQLGFTFEYDARAYGQAAGEERASATAAVDAKERERWRRPKRVYKPGEAEPELYPRPVRKLTIGNRCPARLHSQGVFVRKQQPSERPVAEQMQEDYLSFRTARQLLIDPLALTLPSDQGIRLTVDPLAADEGVYLVLDMGREECGFLELELEAAGGTCIDVAYGEHLDDLRVRAAARGKYFASRYICRDGRQTFTHYFKRWAGRYVQLHISGEVGLSDSRPISERSAIATAAANQIRPGAVTLYYAGLRAVEYPVEFEGQLELPDRLHRKIAEVAVRTLHLCMHEHYEDTPWREQALYAMDARNQALCGYYAFGEYVFPAAANRLFAEGMRADGFLELTAPARSAFTIPSFSFIWVVQLEEHLLYSGDTVAAEALLPFVRRMLDQRLASCGDGLLPTPYGEEYWNFYDWQPGLNGAGKDAKERARVRLDAPLNALFVMALRAAARLAGACGDTGGSERYSAAAERIGATLHERFWDREAGAYRTYAGEQEPAHFAELTQALALCSGICSGAEAGGLRARLAEKDNGLVPVTLSYALFKFEALLGEPKQYGASVLEQIAEQWGHMLFQGATSFWETLDGAEAFGQAGSLCHGWSAVPLYFYYAYVLGVKPTSPGFRTFRAVPIAAGFDRIAGKVPTPHGPIEVDWEQTPSGLEVRVAVPEGVRLEREED